MCPPAKVNGVWPFNDAWLRTSLEEARRQAPRNVASILDSARELGIRDAQGGFDGEIRVPPLPAPLATPAGCPSGDRLRGQPHRHIAASNEGLIVGWPVRNAVLRLVPGMDLRLHPCSVAPAEGPEKCGPRCPTRAGSSCNNAAIRHLVDAATTADPRYTPSTTRREAHTLDTQARYGRWQTAYRALKRRRPRMSDVWYARQIAKQAVAAGCQADTIRRHMTGRPGAVIRRG